MPSMTPRKRRGNPNWGKPDIMLGSVPVVQTEFEKAIERFGLKPDQYIRSTRLREWARKNRATKYIPEPLLEAWGLLEDDHTGPAEPYTTSYTSFQNH